VKTEKDSVIVNADRFCTNCQLRRKVQGGLWVVSKDGKTRRWKCETCSGKLRERGVIK